jgi:hypothetical protein
MHRRFLQKFRAVSAAVTASRTCARFATFDGHEPQHALLIAAQSVSAPHASHASGIAAARAGSADALPDADALGGGDSITGVLDDALPNCGVPPPADPPTATSFGTGASVRHATSANARATPLTA